MCVCVYIINSSPEGIFFIGFRESEGERETSMRERSINWLPPVYVPYILVAELNLQPRYMP